MTKTFPLSPVVFPADHHADTSMNQTLLGINAFQHVAFVSMIQYPRAGHDGTQSAVAFRLCFMCCVSCAVHLLSIRRG